MKKTFNNKKTFNFNKKSNKNLVLASSLFTTFILLYLFNDISRNINFLSITTPISIIFYIFSFICIYFVHEVFGKQNAKHTLYGTTIAIIFLIIINAITSNTLLESNNFYKNILLLLIFFIPHRISLAIYGYLKYKTQYKYLWIRSIVALFIGLTIALILALISYKYTSGNTDIITAHIGLIYGLAFIDIVLLYIIIFLSRKKLFNRKKPTYRKQNGKSFTNDAKNPNFTKKYGKAPRRDQTN